MIGIFLPVLFLIGAVTAREVCYDRVGCFTDNYPWAGTLERPISQLPWSPEKINTRFLMYTRQNPDQFQEVSAANPATILGSNFKATRKSRFIVHGFTDYGQDAWLIDMCKAMLTVEDVNCFCIDWSGGSRTLYTQASNNVRVVGAEIAYFVNTLVNIMKYSPSQVHIIGHSLGSHIAGEAGKRRPGIARITGLDPAEPYFQGTPAEVRLDPSDAAFVDAIHTDSSPLILNLGYGMSQLVGHFDFFPNGGEQMPGCGELVPRVSLLNLQGGNCDLVACNHLRSFRYYIDSITNPDGFIGFQSDSYSAFQQGAGFPCLGNGCALMGHYADLTAGGNSVFQKFYLNTGDVSNFSRWRYKVTVMVAADKNILGSFDISLRGTFGSTDKYQIYSGNIRPATPYSAYIDVEKDVGPLLQVTFYWRTAFINIFGFSMNADTVTVQYGKDGKIYKFCGNKINKDTTQTVNLCSV
ncbi:pancreatic lipase-related protein 2-like [Pelodytes ibericus]